MYRAPALNKTQAFSSARLRCWVGMPLRLSYLKMETEKGKNKRSKLCEWAKKEVQQKTDCAYQWKTISTLYPSGKKRCSVYTSCGDGGREAGNKGGSHSAGAETFLFLVRHATDLVIVGKVQLAHIVIQALHGDDIPHGLQRCQLRFEFLRVTLVVPFNKGRQWCL